MSRIYRLRADAASSVEAFERAWPPPPHDPRERDLVLALSGWEVRVFGGEKFRYFVERGFWHLQLWHAETGVSVLTPSRLTCNEYELYPSAGFKGRAASYAALAQLVAAEHDCRLPREAELRGLELALVERVKTRSLSVS